MIAYYRKENNQVAMVAQGKIKHDKFEEFEFDETDINYQKQKTQGGQLYVKNGKMEYEALARQPIDVQKVIKDAAASAQNFNDFKQILLNNLGT